MHGLVLSATKTYLGQRSKGSFAAKGRIRRPLVQNKYAKSAGLVMLLALDHGSACPYVHSACRCPQGDKCLLEGDPDACLDRDAGLPKPSVSRLNVAASRHEKLQWLELQIIYF